MAGRDGTPGGPRLPVPPRIDDAKVDQVLRDQRRAIEDLAKLPGAGMHVVTGVQLADGIDTAVAHGLGRPPSFVGVSCPRGLTSTALGATGRVVQISSSVDRTKHVVLRAVGWGETIVVDVLVVP